nr:MULTISPECIES: hypothetical protein [Mesorhizobium]
MAESAESSANISAGARHWGVSRGLLPVWHRQAGLVQAKVAIPISWLKLLGRERGRLRKKASRTAVVLHM